MREFYKKYKILIITIMIAAVLWLYVNYQEGNLQESFNLSSNPIRLNINYENLADKLVVLDISEMTVLIEPEGYRFLNTYSAEDFEAYIDLSEVQIGDNIRIVNIRSPQGVQIKRKEPSIVRVTIASYKEENSQENEEKSEK